MLVPGRFLVVPYVTEVTLSNRVCVKALSVWPPPPYQRNEIVSSSTLPPAPYWWKKLPTSAAGLT